MTKLPIKKALNEFEFKWQLEVIAEKIHQNAIDHGFWPRRLKLKYSTDTEVEYLDEIDYKARNKGEMIALMHSELSEMLEAVRGSTEKYQLPDQHCEAFTSEEIEAADLIIRMLDYAYAFKLRLPEAILAKHEFNKSRPMKHNKAF